MDAKGMDDQNAVALAGEGPVDLGVFGKLVVVENGAADSPAIVIIQHIQRTGRQCGLGGLTGGVAAPLPVGEIGVPLLVVQNCVVNDLHSAQVSGGGVSDVHRLLLIDQA